MIRLPAVLCVLALAGCGGGGGTQRVEPKQPRLPHALAHSWADQADAVAAALAANDGCTAQRLAATLQSQVIAAVNARQVSQRFLETLTSGVNDLASRIVCVPPPAPPVEKHDKPKHKDHEKHKDKEKGKH